MIVSYVRDTLIRITILFCIRNAYNRIRMYDVLDMTVNCPIRTTLTVIKVSIPIWCIIFMIVKLHLFITISCKVGNNLYTICVM